MEFIVYTLFALAALFIASELNAVTPQPTPVKAMAKAQATLPRLVISLDDEDQPDPTSEDPANYVQVASESFAAFAESRQIESAPIEWHKFGLRELRQIAKALGVKGFGRMNTPTVKAAIESAIQ